MAFLNVFRKTFTTDETLEEIELQTEVKKQENFSSEPKDVLPVNLTPAQTEEARLQAWAKQKVLEEWRAKASRQ